MPDLHVEIGAVRFRNPIFVASGTFGYGVEPETTAAVRAVGAVVTKSITARPREGNPSPRIVETTGGLLNSIGLANIGVERFLQEVLPVYRDFPAAVIVNIAGSDVDEYCQVLEKIESRAPEIAGYEINVSCPNVDAGGLEFGVSADLTARLTERLRPLTERLLILKLTPNVTDIVTIGRAAQEAGADAVSAINTLIGMSIDPKTWRSRIHRTFGGLSGPAIKPVALACVHKLAAALTIPVIGIGGITSATDAVEFALAGATAVQVGTANFRDPNAAAKIVVDLERYCTERNLKTFAEMVGQVRRYQS